MKRPSETRNCITRTISETRGKVKFYDTTGENGEEEFGEEEFTLTGSLTDAEVKKQMQKKFNKDFGKDVVQVLKVLERKEYKKLYSMSVSDFIEKAELLEEEEVE